MKKIFTLFCAMLCVVALSAQPGGKKKAYEDYGDLVKIFSEDFSKMTTGSYGAPDFMTSICLDMGDYEYVWWNIKPEFTNVPHWGGINVWSAGGAVYLESTVDMGGARLSLPNIDGTAHGGRVILRFKARAEAGQMCNCAVIEGGETNNMGPEWRTFPSQTVGQITDEWNTYEFLFEEVGPTSIFAIVVDKNLGTNLAPFYVDDVELLQIDAYIDSPELLSPTNYTTEGNFASFQVNWKPVEEAEYYLLDVFKVDALGNISDYLLQDQRVEGTSYLVEGAESGATYYYTVRACNSQYESMPSPKMKVEGLGVPENLSSTELVDGKYSASWDVVPTANYYNYLAYYDRKAETSGAFSVTDEKMDNLHFPEGMTEGSGENQQLSEWAGKKSTLTVEQYLIEKDKIDHAQSGVDPFYFQALGRYDLTDLKQSGWYATNAQPYADCIRLDGWFYQYGAGEAGMISPALDLSKNGGAFKLDVKSFGITDEFGNLTSCGVALFNYDKEKSAYVQSELIYSEQRAQAWQDNTFNFSTGTTNSMLGIYALRGAESLFIKDVKLTQNYEAGESFHDPFFAASHLLEPQTEVVLPGHVMDADVYHRVQAVRMGESSNPNIAFTEMFSDFCEEEFVGHGSSTGICTPSATIAGATVQFLNNQLVVNNADNATVEVYTLAGEKVYTDNSGKATINIPTQARGAYIVKVGKQTIKVVL